MEIKLKRIEAIEKDADALCKGCIFYNSKYTCHLDPEEFECETRIDDNQIVINKNWIWVKA